VEGKEAGAAGAGELAARAGASPGRLQALDRAAARERAPERHLVGMLEVGAYR